MKPDRTGERYLSNMNKDSNVDCMFLVVLKEGRGSGDGFLPRRRCAKNKKKKNSMIETLSRINNYQRQASAFSSMILPPNFLFHFSRPLSLVEILFLRLSDTWNRERPHARSDADRRRMTDEMIFLGCTFSCQQPTVDFRPLGSRIR